MFNWKAYYNFISLYILVKYANFRAAEILALVILANYCYVIA
jgi:hypothetical protein